LREREVARFPDWLGTLALSLPRLELISAQAEPLGQGADSDSDSDSDADGERLWRVRLVVGNAGYLPQYVTKRAQARKTVRGVVMSIDLPEGAVLVSGKPREEAAQLEGHAPATSLQAFLPARSVTGDRTHRDWIVRAPAGARLVLAADGGRAGKVRAALTLDR